MRCEESSRLMGNKIFEESIKFGVPKHSQWNRIVSWLKEMESLRQNLT